MNGMVEALPTMAMATGMAARDGVAIILGAESPGEDMPLARAHAETEVETVQASPLVGIVVSQSVLLEEMENSYLFWSS